MLRRIRVSCPFSSKAYSNGPKEIIPFTVSTFRPERLKPADCLKSLPHPFRPFYHRPVPKPPLKSLDDRHVGSSISWEVTEPPQPCKGFLYYHSPTREDHPAASLRFRRTPDFDPVSGVSPQSAFSTGSDLLIPNAGGLPWSLPIRSLAKRNSFASTRGILRADGYKVPPPSDIITQNSLTLYALGQPFLVEFHMHAIGMWVLRPGLPSVHGRIINMGFTDMSSKLYRQPYAGMGIMTLERLADGSLVTCLQKIISMSQAFKNDLVPPLVEGMTRPLQLAPILFKEKTKPTSPKYVGAKNHLAGTVAKLPHISELDIVY
ncbi:hypothetical protein DFH07DRAFT_261775 [Mycena maculata]|uniref:Uncharacterized protein n=1 Tax=Mycena maculata TaxID=230809 RepID=A0AAD7HNT7_9AGAR|nr:hypothetical protein DFH07DRAFT_261775 [Mycena maculata]